MGYVPFVMSPSVLGTVLSTQHDGSLTGAKVVRPGGCSYSREPAWLAASRATPIGLFTKLFAEHTARDSARGLEVDAQRVAADDACRARFSEAVIGPQLLRALGSSGR
jgi:hypothetical protein